MATAAAKSTKPTVLFVHGSWHSPAHFRPVRDLFEEHGYATVCPQLPTYGGEADVSMYDDAACLREELDRLVTREGRLVFVVMHGYGGVPGTQACHEDYSQAAREERGQPGGIIHLLYICAFTLTKGMSTATLFGGRLPPFITLSEDGSCRMTEPEQRFFHDVQPESQRKHWVSLLDQLPTRAGMDPVTYESYKYHPISYLFTEDDRALMIELQKTLVFALPVDVDTYSCPSGFSPYLSMPKEVLKLVDKIVGEQGPVS